jgi:hypothetical protein
VAVNSKADKRHSLTHKSVVAQVGIQPGTPTKPIAFSASQPANAPPTDPISQAGQKALQFRAKKVLAPLADPTQAIAE